MAWLTLSCGSAWASDGEPRGEALLLGDLGQTSPYGDDVIRDGAGFRWVELDGIFPEGITYGGQVHHELFVSSAGIVSFGLARGYARDNLPRAPGAPFWAIYESNVADQPSNREDVDHHVYIHRVPATPDTDGELVVTWNQMGLWPDVFHIYNTFQMRLYREGGEHRLELRYAVCYWTGSETGEPARHGFDYGDGTGWQWAEDDVDAAYRLCSLTNAEAPGIWRYRLVEGRAVGCGDGIEQPGEACDDGNGWLNDGCTPDCRREQDVDGDGWFEAPPEAPFVVPIGTYDDCLPDWAVPAGQRGCEADPDQDGIHSAVDNCPRVWNVDQIDSDRPADGIGDGAGDACDSDDDNDGLNDAVDNCPLVRNGPDDVGLVPQADLDGDGIGDVCDADADGDGIDEVHDNCPGRANPAQIDRDGDGFGAACDDDDRYPSRGLALRGDRRQVQHAGLTACAGRPCAPAGADDPGRPGGETAPDQRQPPPDRDLVIAEPGPDAVLNAAQCSARPGAAPGGPLALLGLLVLAGIRRWRHR